jgi:hypothetical protein
MQAIGSSQKDIEFESGFISSIEPGVKAIIVVLLCPTSQSAGNEQCSLVHGKTFPGDFDPEDCRSVCVYNCLYGHLQDKG